MVELDTERQKQIKDVLVNFMGDLIMEEWLSLPVVSKRPPCQFSEFNSTSFDDWESSLRKISALEGIKGDYDGDLLIAWYHTKNPTASDRERFHISPVLKRQGLKKWRKVGWKFSYL